MTRRDGPVWGTGAELAAGDRLGPYLVEARLGHGATGIVFRAVRDDDSRAVALKVLRRPLSADEQFVRRFLREAAVARAVANSHLVPIVEAGEAEGRHYLASEYVEGGSLRDRLAEVGVLPLRDVARLAAGIGAALDALHEADLVHRDVKPSNVMLTADGRALLADFGLAKGPAHSVVTRPGELMGTPAYMAPELIRRGGDTVHRPLRAGVRPLRVRDGRGAVCEPEPRRDGRSPSRPDPPDPSETRSGLRPSLGSALHRALDHDPPGGLPPGPLLRTSSALRCADRTATGRASARPLASESALACFAQRRKRYLKSVLAVRHHADHETITVSRLDEAVVAVELRPTFARCGRPMPRHCA